MRRKRRKTQPPKTSYSDKPSSSVSFQQSTITGSIVGVQGDLTINLNTKNYFNENRTENRRVESEPQIEENQSKEANIDIEATERELKKTTSTAMWSLCQKTMFTVDEFAVVHKATGLEFVDKQEAVAKLYTGSLEIDNILQGRVEIECEHIQDTTYAKLLVQHVLSSKLLDSTFLFYISFSDIDLSKKCNVLQFLLCSIAPHWDHSPESDRVLLKKIDRDENVIIVIDGVHDVPTHDSLTEITLFSICSSYLILKNIMREEILKKALTIFTYSPKMKPQFLSSQSELKVIGLKKSSQDIYWKKTFSKMQNVAQVAHYCHIPVVKDMAFSFFSSMSDSTHLTMSLLFTNKLCQALTSNGIHECVSEFKNFCCVLWQCVFPNCTNYILKRDIEDLEMNWETIPLLLNFADRLDLHVNISLKPEMLVLCLSSEIWKEYFASIYLFGAQIDESERHWKQFYMSDNIKMFLFGLCNRQVFTMLKRFIPDLLTDKRDVIKKHLVKHLLDKGYYNLIEVANLLYSAQDHDMLLQVVAGWDFEKVELECQLLPSDMASLGYVLKCYVEEGGSVGTVIVVTHQRYKCHFVDDAFNVLCTEIESGILIKKLVLSEVELGDNGAESLSGCLPQIDHLAVEQCKITAVGLKQFTKCLQDTKLNVLHLGSNRIMDEGAKLLAPCLENLNELYLDNCHITYTGVEKLSECLLKLPIPISCLSLKGNEIENKGAEFLSKCLEKIRKLLLSMCQITDQGMVKIADKAKDLLTPIECLDLSDNDIGKNGREAFSQCDGKILTLKLMSCGLSPRQLQIMKESLKNVVLCSSDEATM